MRFHFGVSFRLSYLKKFIFPILFGVLAYFLSSYINLGQVYALVNTDTTFNITFEEIDYTTTQTFTDKNAKQVMDEIISTYVYTTHDLLVTTYYQNNTYTLYIYLSPHTANIQMGVEAYQNYMYYYNDTSYTALNGVFFFKFQSGQEFTSSDSINYQRLLSCLRDASSCSPTNTQEGGTSSTKINTMYRTDIFKHGSNMVNSDSYTFPSKSSYGWIYYSSNSLVYNINVDSNSQTRFTKNLIINGVSIEEQDDLPTYLDLFPPDEPGPDEPGPDEPGTDEPTDSNVPFSSKVYWFGEHSTTEEILENIYILLFLSFSGIFFLKVITIIKNTRW